MSNNMLYKLNHSLERKQNIYMSKILEIEVFVSLFCHGKATDSKIKFDPLISTTWDLQNPNPNF